MKTAAAAPKSERKSTGRKSLRSTFSPTSQQLIHATAETLLANQEPVSLGEAIIDKLDDFGEKIRFGLFGGGEAADPVNRTEGLNDGREASVDSSGRVANNNHSEKEVRDAGSSSVDWQCENQQIGTSAAGELIVSRHLLILVIAWHQVSHPIN